MSTAYSSMNGASGLSQTNGAGLKYKKLNDSKPLGGNKSQNGMKTNGNTRATTTTATKAVGSKLEEQFKAACDAIQNLPKNGPFQPSNEMLLKFYAYFKQATVGPANSSRPSMFKVVERAKYDAWNSVRHLNREEAMQGYIDEIKNIIETMPHSEHVEKLLKAIGPFYEYVNEDSGHDEENEEEDDDDDEEDDDDEDEEVARNNTSGEGCNGGGGEADAVTTSMSSCIMVASTASSVVEPLEYKPNGAAKFNGGGGGASHHVNGGSNHLKKLNGDTSLGLLNGSASSSNDRDYPSDDEEDYCDTSDIIIDAKQAEAAKARLNGNHLGVVDDDSATQLELLLASTSSVANRWNGVNNEAKGDHQNGAFRPIVTNASSASRSANESGLGLGTINGNSAVSTTEDSNHSTNCGVAVVENRFGIYKCGGETNSPQSSGLPYGGGGSQQASRQSRPGSSMSQSNMPGGGYPDRRSYGGGAGGAGSGGGSGGGGNPTTSDYLMAQETNRQILLILVRLREDTNNVLTRLSFLESSVVSLQTNLQMNGGGFQQLINNNNGAGHSHSVALNRNSNNANSGGFFYSLVEFVRTIDWKTVTIAMLWPFIIRLVFYFFKKCRVVLKLKRIRN